jgi:hypothetical protein
LDKEAKKEDKKLRDAQLKVEGILGLQGAGSPRKKRKTSSSSEVVYKHLLARRFPVGTRIQGFFKGEEEASPPRWYPGTVVGHTSHGCTMWVKYDSDEEPWEQKLDFSLNPQECRLIGPKASTHRLMLSASASAAAKGVAAPASSPAGLVSGSFREITLQQADQTIGLALENGQTERKGVCVSSTTNGSLAASAKFKAGDIVVAINGFKVNSAEDAVTVITALRGEGTLKYVFTLSDGAASDGVGTGDAGEFPESLLVPSVCMPQTDGLRSVESEGLVPIVSSSPAVVKTKKHTAAKEATSAMGIRLDDEDIAQEPAAAKVPDSAIGVRPHDNDAIAKESAAAKDAVSALGIRLGNNENASKESATAKEAASVMPAVASAAQEACVTSAASAASAAQRGLFVTPAAMVQTKHHLLNMQRQMHTLMDQLP